MNSNPKKFKSFLPQPVLPRCSGLAVIATQTDISSAQASNFQGGAPQVTEGPDDARYIRILFPAGVRSSWHSHTWGQLLMIEEGIGLHQIRGRAIEEFQPGEPFWTPAGVEHWHGPPDVRCASADDL